MSIFDPPPAAGYNFLSLGGGVQSSTLALMAEKGEILQPDLWHRKRIDELGGGHVGYAKLIESIEWCGGSVNDIPMEPNIPDAAIFADTKAEPRSVYKWLDWLEKQLSFPVIRVTRGSITEESLRLRQFKNDPTKHWVKSLIPAFVATPAGWYPPKEDRDADEEQSLLLHVEAGKELVWREAQKGLMGRQCTFNYKVEMLEKEARRLAGITHGQKHVSVTQWIGISYDEMQRMRTARKPWVRHRWPLIELRMTREKCIGWMLKNGYPRPPRSACKYCPFHSDEEWRRLRDEEPEEFQECVQFEKDLQAVKAISDNMRAVPFLHSSMVPLDQVDFSTDAQRGQGAFDFTVECEGMCGV